MPEWNWQKIKQMLRDTLRVCHLRFWTFAIWKLCTILQPRYYPKIIGHILVKNKQKNKCVCFNEIIRLIIMKMEMKMKNTSHRYDINRTRFSHEHKYSKYKKHLSMTMLTCITQHLSNIWSAEDLETLWLSWKKAMLKKSVYYI